MKNLTQMRMPQSTNKVVTKKLPQEQVVMDIVTVTCNDQKWFPAYLDSLVKQENIDLKCINLIVVDNNSKEENFKVLEECREKAEAHLGSFKVLPQNKNLGFAGACNVGSRISKGELVFFLNIDTELEINALNRFYKSYNESTKDFGAWEFRQFPYEHPKIYNVVTGEISWASGAALIIRRHIFEELNGFDTNFYMYNDDVDLSWRVRMLGHKIKYLPECVVYHYSYQSFNDVKPLQYYYSIFNNLQLRFKFGNKREIKEGFRIIKNVFKERGPFENSRKKLLKLMLKSSFKLFKQRRWFLQNKKQIQATSPHKFIHFDYELRRLGDFFYNEYPKTQPLVSVIVRTVNRYHVLRETLLSLQKQTYKHIEVVIVEDGRNHSEENIKEEFGDLNIKYLSTGRKSGRTVAGNLGLKNASGEFLAFLDDDDLLYADHFEVLVRQTERNPNYKIFHNFSFEAKTRTLSRVPYVYNFESMDILHRKRFNLLRLSLHNFLPIQTVLFHHEVFDTLGGFDENLDMLEDWDLWIKYASGYAFYSVFKTCSIYKIPAEKDIADRRIQQLHAAYDDVRMKQVNYTIKTNPIELSKLFKNIEQ